MSTSYSRVKWIIQDVTRQSISDWDGRAGSEPFYVAMKGDIITEWYLETIINKERNGIKFYLNRDKYSENDQELKIFLNIYVRCGDQVWNCEKQVNEDDEYETWGWKRLSSLDNLFFNMLDKTDNSITFEIVFNVKEKEEKIESLKFRCEQALMDGLCSNNILEMLEIAMIYKESRLEEKCLSLIMLHYDDLKQTESWKNLKPPVAARIIDILHRSVYAVRKNTLPQGDTEWDEISFMSDLVHELGFNTSDEDDQDHDSDLDYFGGVEGENDA